MSYQFTLPVPPSANVYWRTRVVTPRGRKPFVSTYVSPEAVAYKAQVAKLVSIPTPVECEIAITVEFFRAQKSGDLDNRLKCLFDALQGVLYANDSQVIEIHAFRYDDKRNPRMQVEVELRAPLTLFSDID